MKTCIGTQDIIQNTLPKTSPNRNASSLDLYTGAENTFVSCAPCSDPIQKRDHLPRQTRDKPEGKVVLRNERHVSAGVFERIMATGIPIDYYWCAKRLCLVPLHARSRTFAETGSGQMKEKVKEHTFCRLWTGEGFAGRGDASKNISSQVSAK